MIKTLSVLIVTLFLVIVALRLLVLHPYETPSVSMEPTVNQGDYFLALDFGFTPKRGDIIVFNVPNKNEVYLKRIIGLPGDKIAYNDGVFAINGQTLSQTPNGANIFTEKTPEGVSYNILIEGSNKNNFFGPFSTSYEVPANSYFVVGDNRNNSHDSRFADFGYIAEDTIKGKVIYDTHKTATQLHIK